MKSFLLLWIFLISFGEISASPDDFDKNNITKQESNSDRIDDFWKWFKANEGRLKNFETDPDKYLNELLAQSKKIKEGIAIELEPPENGVINMTVSANGDLNLFETVKSIVAKAPKISGWQFFAFRQRIDASRLKDLKLKIGKFELDPHNMKFYPVIEADSLNIIIYVTGLNEDNFNDIAYGGLLILDNILGEYDCVTKVKSYDFHPMPAKKEELKDLLPLIEIAEYVDKFHAEKKPGK